VTSKTAGSGAANAATAFVTVAGGKVNSSTDPLNGAPAPGASCSTSSSTPTGNFTAYNYDAVGNLTQTARGGRTIGYAYDDAGRLGSVDYPESLGSVNLTYDPAGRLASMSDWASRVTSFTHDAAGRLTELDRPGSLATTYAYDDANRPTSIDYSYSGTSVLDLAYTYDSVGNVLSKTDDTGTATFSYDALDRLTAANYPGSLNYAYGYDPAGNLTQLTSPAGTVNHSYDAADRISDTGYTFDDSGRLLSDGIRTFSYDALGRLTAVSASGLSASYAYDGDGNRVSQTLNGTTTAFDLDLVGAPSVLVAGTDAYLPGAPDLGAQSAGSWSSSLADAQGSVLEMIGSSGTVSGSVRYDPYGAPLPGSASLSGVGFTGEWSDATGLVNLRARLYDPTLGRFLSRDTFPGHPAVPLTGNPYAYAIDNPLRYTDPSGHDIGGVLNAGGQTLLGIWDGLWGFGSGTVNTAVGAAGWAFDTVTSVPGAAVDWWNHPTQNLVGTLDTLGDAAAGTGPWVGRVISGFGDWVGDASQACRSGDYRACAGCDHHRDRDRRAEDCGRYRGGGRFKIG